MKTKSSLKIKMVRKLARKMDVCKAIYRTGDFVFAKLRGFPMWPSIVREATATRVLVDFICPERSW